MTGGGEKEDGEIAVRLVKKQHSGAQLAPWDSLWRKSGLNLLSGTAQYISPS